MMKQETKAENGTFFASVPHEDKRNENKRFDRITGQKVCMDKAAG